MTTRRILLLGSRGQLGHALQHSLAPLGDITAIHRQLCDLSNPDAVQRLLNQHQPDCIVNAAAYTAVDAAENHADLAMQLNAKLPQHLAEYLDKHGGWLVHYSSDYVYSGTKRTPYLETDPAAPLNTYGRSKLAGDQAAASHEQHLILRTSWVFHHHGSNFLRTILQRARQQSHLQVVNDQYGVPNSAALIANVTAKALDNIWHGQGKPGLYNLASHGSTTWYDYARYLLTEAQRLGIRLQCSPDGVSPIASTALNQAACRPQYSLLNTSKICHTFNLTLPDWQDNVTAVIQEIFQQEQRCCL